MIQLIFKQKCSFFFTIMISAIGFLLPVALLANEGNAVDKYPSPPTKGEIIFEDSFQDNKNKWLVEENSMVKINMENGKYIIEQKIDGIDKIILNYQFNIPDNVNLRIDVSIEKIPGSDNSGYGIVWGSQDINYHYKFYISDNGSFSVKKRERGIDSEVIKWKKYREDGIQSQSNKLTIVKYECVTYFFINDQYAGEALDLLFYGGRAGFTVEGKQKITVSNIRVDRLEADEAYAGKKCPEPEKIIDQGNTGEPAEEK
ncbi:MAG: hypothetical protein HY758_10475 [Nitrospirae bacterium]|nr:hypothetical protein [Nitrospirota bacterium]